MNKIQEVMGLKMNQTDFLEHHGILGQRWGFRRYQNADGSLTNAGRERYGVGSSKKKQSAKSQSQNKRQEAFDKECANKNISLSKNGKEKIDQMLSRTQQYIEGASTNNSEELKKVEINSFSKIMKSFNLNDKETREYVQSEISGSLDGFFYDYPGITAFNKKSGLIVDRKNATEYYDRLTDKVSQNMGLSEKDHDFYCFGNKLERDSVSHSYLAHHGTKGQKWGKRLYQYEDGSLTALGRIHYGIGEKRNAKQEAKKQARALKDELYKEKIRKRNEAIIEREKNKIREKFEPRAEKDPSKKENYLGKKSANKKLKWKDTSKISDADLQNTVRRLQLEKQYTELMNSKWESKSAARIKKLKAMGKNFLSVASNKDLQKNIESASKFLSKLFKDNEKDSNESFSEKKEKVEKEKVEKEKVEKEKVKKEKVKKEKTTFESVKEDPMVEIITPSSAKNTTTSIINSFTPEYSFSTASASSYSTGYDYVTKLLT